MHVETFVTRSLLYPPIEFRSQSTEFDQRLMPFGVFVFVELRLEQVVDVIRVVLSGFWIDQLATFRNQVARFPFSKLPYNFRPQSRAEVRGLPFGFVCL